jgi:hypothetical protein
MKSQDVFEFIDDLKNGGLNLVDSNGRIEDIPGYISYLQSLGHNAIMKKFIDILHEISELKDVDWQEDSLVDKLESSIFDLLDEIEDVLTPHWELEAKEK